MRLSDMNRVALARFISRSGGEAAFFVGIWGKASYEFNATPSELALVMAALGCLTSGLDLVGIAGRPLGTASGWRSFTPFDCGNRKGRRYGSLS